MATQGVEVHRRVVHRLAAKCVASNLTDSELLDLFSSQADQQAFEVLVHRHAALVLATARRILGNAHDAEDVCQAAFLLLAQKAASRRWQPSVASWLHQTAHHLALKARRTVARRDRREERAAPRHPTEPLDELTGRELLAVLDEELLALPEPLRAPLVLCYLEGMTRDEAAEHLGCPLSTLKKRLERGRSQLHAALTRRGLGLSVGLLSTLLSREAATAVPAALVRLTANNALSPVPGVSGDGAVSPRINQLLQGGMGMAGWKKFKAVLGILLVGGLLSVAAFSAGGDKPTPPTKDKTAASEKAEPPAAPAIAKSMRVVVLDPEGKPVSGANVHVSVWTEEPDFKAKRDLATDAKGVVRVDLPKSFTILRLWARKKPFAALHAAWEQAEVASNGVPAEYTFRMEAASKASGRIVDEQGKPIEGARVEVMLNDDLSPVGSDGRVQYDGYLAEDHNSVVTDSNGLWQIAAVPNRPETKLRLKVSHSDFVSDRWWSEAIIPTEKFRDGTATVTLKRGVVVRGRVTDTSGKPVKDAAVVHGDEPYYLSRYANPSVTDSDGRYRLPPLPPGKTSLTVVARGWVPQLCNIEIKHDLSPQDFRLGPGKRVRLRIVDTTGKAVPRAQVTLMEWRGSKSIRLDRNPNDSQAPDTGIPSQASADGVWEWSSAPADPVKIGISVEGFAPTEFAVTGGMAERTVVLKSKYRISGTVTDATTGKPIPAFNVIPVSVVRKDFLAASRGNAVAGRNGRLAFLAPWNNETPHRLRVEAPGYRTQDGPEFRFGDDRSRVQNFRLQPSRPLTGVILHANGTPVAKTEVRLATLTEQARLFDTGGIDSTHKSFTDEAGRFTFPNPGEPWAIAARTDAGVVIAEFPADRLDAGTLKLRPWGSIRGQFRDAGKPVDGCDIAFEPIRLWGLHWPRLIVSGHVVTDSEGRFEFHRVPPGPVSVYPVQNPRWKERRLGSAPNVPLDVPPGGRVDLDLSSSGATLTGKVKLTGKVPADLNCTHSMNVLVRREPGVIPPSNLAALGFDIRKGFQDTWLRTHEGLAYLQSLRFWFVQLTPDGSFQISGVPPGEYDLAVGVYAKTTGCLTDPLARRVVRVTVTAADVARGELAVPEIAAEVVPIAGVNDTPTLAFERADGTKGTFADCRGKYTVVHFWASWCVPCKKQLPALRKLHDRFAARGVATLSLMLDDDPAAWKAALKGAELPWPQGRVSSESPHGVSGVPAYWLLDPAGKIVAKASDVDELAKEIEGRLKETPPGDR